jgi:hypothetical protein
MTSRPFVIAALAAAVAMCAYFFIGGGTSKPAVPTASSSATDAGGVASAAPRDAAGKNLTATSPAPGAAEKKPEVNWKRFTAMMGGTDGSGDAMPKPTSEDIARFLAKHGETAVNLVAAFEKTRDRRLLDRALELFPNSPVVLMAAIEAAPPTAAKVGEKYGPDAERLALIDRFKAADPNNPLPWIYSAQELFKSGPNSEAIAEIRAALDRPAFYTYANERMDSAQRLYEDLGLHPVEASLLAMAGLTLPHMSAATQTSRMLMEWQKSATDSGDTAAANDALRLTFSLGRTFATPEASRTLIGQLVGISMETRALKALPADAQPDWLTVNPAQRLAEIDKLKQDVKEIASGLDWVIQSQNEKVLTEYLRRMRTEGESSAFAWLKSQMK